MKTVRFALPLLSALLFAACGGPDSSTGSAVLAGKVLRADGTAAPQLSVSLSGTPLSTQTDAAGHFELRSAPSGRARLHVSDGASEAEVELLGLEDGRTTAVQVRFHGQGQAELEPPEAEIELRGAIDSIAAPDLRVAGHVVHTSATTQLERDGAKIALADLTAGELVKVEGTQGADGSIDARELKAGTSATTGGGSGSGGGDDHGGSADGGTSDDSGPATSGQGVEFTSIITALAAPDFTAAGRTLHTDAQTSFEKHASGGVRTAASFADLAVGQTVQVYGILQTDGSVLAKFVELEDGAAEAEFTGAISAIALPNLTVAGRTVVTSASTETDVALSTLKVGDLVEVRGTLNADGTVAASRIHKEHD